MIITDQFYTIQLLIGVDEDNQEEYWADDFIYEDDVPFNEIEETYAEYVKQNPDKKFRLVKTTSELVK